MDIRQQETVLQPVRETGGDAVRVRCRCMSVRGSQETKPCNTTAEHGSNPRGNEHGDTDSPHREPDEGCVCDEELDRYST